MIYNLSCFIAKANLLDLLKNTMISYQFKIFLIILLKLIQIDIKLFMKVYFFTFFNIKKIIEIDIKLLIKIYV